MKPRFFLLVIVSLLLFTLGRGDFAVAEIPTSNTSEIEVLNKEIAARKDAIKQLEATIAIYKKNIDEKQTQAVSLKNQLSILDNHVAQTQADIDLTKEKIKQAELEIAALGLTIADKEKTMARQQKIVATMVQNIYASDQKNYIEIMLSYGNFSEFYNELKNTESVYVDLGRSVRTLRLAKEDLAEKKRLVEVKRTSYRALQQDLEDKKSSLALEVGAKKNLLDQTKSSERKFATLLGSLKAQYQVIEAEERTFEAKVRKKLQEQDKIQAATDVLFSWPVPSHYINSRFHDPDYPYRKVFEHSGIDIRAAQGTVIRATGAGYVARARHCSVASCYSYVLLVHTDNLSTLYGHLSAITIADDAFVNRGDIIGYSGGTPGTAGAGPFVTGPHLHFEVRLNGIPTDPLNYLTR